MVRRNKMNAGRPPINPFLEDDDEDQQVENENIDETDVESLAKSKAWESIMDPSIATGITDDETIKKVDVKEKRHKTILIVIALIALIALIGAICYAGYQLKVAQSAYNSGTSVTAPTPKRKSVVSEKTGSGQYNPAAKSKDVLDAADGDVNGSVDNNTIVIKVGSSEHRVQFPALTDKINASSKACVLKEKASNCYIGTSKVNDKDVKLYVTRDAKTNALLTGSSSPQIVQQNGAAVAYTRPYQLQGQQSYGLIVVMPDQTAVIAISSDQNAIAAMAAGNSHFQATSAGQQ